MGTLSLQTYTGADGSAGAVRKLSTPERTQVCVLIADTLLAVDLAGQLRVPVSVCIRAAYANAWGESRFDPGAWRREPDGRMSFGLFQCLQGGGLGDGHHVSDLLDPVYNTRLIAAECIRVAGLQAPIGQLAPQLPQDVAGLTRWWCTYVERPRDPVTAGNERVTWLRSWGAAE